VVSVVLVVVAIVIEWCLNVCNERYGTIKQDQVQGDNGREICEGSMSTI
jgi:hypothetical protein